MLDDLIIGLQADEQINIFELFEELNQEWQLLNETDYLF